MVARILLDNAKRNNTKSNLLDFSSSIAPAWDVIANLNKRGIRRLSPHLCSRLRIDCITELTKFRGIKYNEEQRKAYRGKIMKAKILTKKLPVQFEFTPEEAELLKFGIRAIEGFNPEIEKAVSAKKAEKLLTEIEAFLTENSY